jgi:hypothetical protein
LERGVAVWQGLRFFAPSCQPSIAEFVDGGNEFGLAMYGKQRLWVRARVATVGRKNLIGHAMRQNRTRDVARRARISR